MNIVDTSLWIEFFAGTSLDKSIVNVLSNNNELYVPTICLYEVKKKFLTDNDAVKAVSAIDIMKKGMVIDIDSEIALLASDISKQHKLPMADSIIYATAVLWDAELYTQDKHFENLDRIHYFLK
ncbi:MAG: type II toxin-antitoxin system VapC family toxin [Treponema sp.]|jgi:predicted nucleic acid-binding protein|nr:type II toxin-antitoxin system VapC family toxin [Treponema sp.]